MAKSKCFQLTKRVRTDGEVRNLLMVFMVYEDGVFRLEYEDGELLDVGSTMGCPAARALYGRLRVEGWSTP